MTLVTYQDHYILTMILILDVELHSNWLVKLAVPNLIISATSMSVFTDHRRSRSSCDKIQPVGKHRQNRSRRGR